MKNAHEEIASALCRLDSNGRQDSAAVANTTLFVARELTQVRNKVLEVKYPELRTMSFLPMATDINPLFDDYSYQITDSYGQARIINKNDVGEMPTVQVGTTEATGKVVTIGLAYGWNLLEMRLANLLGKPLDSRLATQCRRGHMYAIDELLRTGKLASTGQVANGLGGFLNNTDVNTGSSGLTFSNWLSVGSAPTALTIYNDLNRFVAAADVQTNGLYKTDTILMASLLFQVANTRPMFENGGDTTILKYFLANNPGINVASWTALNSTGDGTIGTSGYHQMVAYKRDPGCLEGVVPLEFEQLAPQISGLQTTIPCMSRCGGVKIYVPASMRYGFVSHVTT
jgi:hypothetical protein